MRSIREALTGEKTQVNPAPPDSELSTILKRAAGIKPRPAEGSLDEFLERTDWPVERDEDLPGPLRRLAVSSAYEEATAEVRNRGLRVVKRVR